MMHDAKPQPIRLADYRPPNHLIDHVELTFRLDPTATRVQSRIAFRPNPDGLADGNLQLDGENLRLISATIDGTPLTALDYMLSDTGLTVPADRLPDTPFTWEAEVEIDPSANTALEGLYLSNGMFCTQCEAEGFRKITFYPDRPDVMAPFTVHIDSDLAVLLSNGNPARGAGFARNPNRDRAFSATWTDPWPKPAYLFALVAGDLIAHRDQFITASGRSVDLNIWVRPGDEGKCAYAMDALKRAMLWDERVYGREYDLDVFNIVAVDDFNMGAMENKGLNIFNSKYVLASPDTATDRDYDFIERIVAHEYFHNWTGNRITCRDWFQLCLKEGLTVFRDQQFSADMRSAPVKRIEEVQQLRARQFREDAGPLAHSVRPESYIEINNFYTATVYEKGAELIRMLRGIVGAELYDAALDLYFSRHDGQACTIEDWIAVFEDVTLSDLSQFKLWYSQAGTPKLAVACDVQDGRATLTLSQSIAPTPGQPLKQPAVIPVRLGLLSPDGTELLPDTDILLDTSETAITVDLAPLADARNIPVPDRVIPSLLRGFSAPVLLDHPFTPADRRVLLAHDTDPFTRFEAGRALARDSLIRGITDGTPPDAEWLAALDSLASDPDLDTEFRALVLQLPSEDDLAEALHGAGIVPDPTTIHRALADTARAIGTSLRPTLETLYDTLVTPGPYTPDAAAAGRRSLRHGALRYLSEIDGGARAQALFDGADNMTDQMGAFTALITIDAARDAIAAFAAQWSDDRLVMDKWFMAQIAHCPPDRAVDTARALTEHPLFDAGNPNRFRAVIGGLTSGNPAGFHDPSGAGYAFVADWLIALDRRNPQTAARMSTAFDRWRRYDADRQQLMQGALERMAGSDGVSRDMTEMVGRMLDPAPGT